MFRSLSLLGDTYGLLIGLAVIRWLFGRDAIYAVIPLLIIEAASYLLINTFIYIPRPTAAEVLQYEQLSMSAFPSGHTYMATVLWGYLYSRGAIPLLFAAAVPVGVGIGRLYLGVHHVGDVIGGLLLGALVVWGYTKVWPRLKNHLYRPSFRFYRAAAGAVVAATPVVLLVIASNPRWWQVGGIAAGTAVALTLLGKDSVDRALDRPGTVRAALLAVALAGLTAAILIDWSLPAGPFPSAAVALAAALWALLVPGLVLRGTEPARGVPDPASVPRKTI